MTAAYDPFLESNERDTPDECLALRKVGSAPNAPDWLLRVVPNRYPVVVSDTSDHESKATHFSSSVAWGIHEVVIECPDFRRHLADFSVSEVTRILFAWQLRLNTICAQTGPQPIRIFRNEGAKAGASLQHCHSQIVATKQTPDPALDELIAAGNSKPRASDNVLYGRWIEEELRAQQRIIAIRGNHVVVCPFASRVARQVRICPQSVLGGDVIPYGRVQLQELQQLAATLLSSIRALRQTQGDLAYNLLLAFSNEHDPENSPWMLDVIPRTSQFAGFELLADADIITVTPEDAAADMRKHAEWLECPDTSDSLWPADYQWV